MKKIIERLPYKRKLLLVLSAIIVIPYIILSFGYLNMVRNDIHNSFIEEKNNIVKSGLGNIQSTVDGLYEKIDFVTKFNKLSQLLGSDNKISILEALESSREINNVFEAFFPKSDTITMVVYTTNPNIYDMKYITKIPSSQKAGYDELSEGEAVQKIIKSSTGDSLAIYKKYNVFNEYYNVVCLSIPFKALGRSIEGLDEETDYAFYCNTNNEYVSFYEADKESELLLNSSFADKNYYFVRHTVPYLEGEIITVFDKSESNRKFGESLGYIIFALIVILCLLIFLLNFIATSLTKKLTNVIREIRVGNEAELGIPDFKDEFDIIKDKLTELFNETKVENEKILTLEIEMLHMKISPHFLYNNLSAIKWNLNDESMGEIVDVLVSYYRNAFQKAASECTLSQEVEGIKKYIELLKFSYNKDFKFEIQMEERYLSYSLPSNILQPLVENAFIYGVNCLEDGKGEIKLIAYETDGKFCIEISDNGNNADAALLNEMIKTSAAPDDSAIHVINRRIRLYYGENYGLRYTIRGGNTVAGMLLPNHRKQEVLM